MIYSKTVSNGYVMSVLKAEYQSDIDGVPITEAEYLSIHNAIKKVPSAVDGYARKLRADTLEWELVELPPVEPEEEEPTIKDKAEAYDILVGEEGCE